MEQYIKKSTLMAEMEDDLLDKGRYHEEYDCAYRDGNNGALYALKNKIDTIEVKEVDLEKEATEFVQTKEFTESKESPVLLIAKHFFELGLNSQTKDMQEALRTEYEKGRHDVIVEIEKCYEKAITADAQAYLIKDLLDRLKTKKQV